VKHELERPSFHPCSGPRITSPESNVPELPIMQSVKRHHTTHGTNA
jgi:hypothetical protein